MIVGVAFLAFLGFSGYQAKQARDDFARVSDDVTRLSQQVSAGDVGAARQTLVSLQADARAARDHTHGPGWWVTERIPALGANVKAIRTVADAADSIAEESLPGFLDAADQLTPQNLRPSGGRIDVGRIAKAQPQVLAATSSLGANVAAVQGIDPEALVPALGTAVTTLQTHLDQALSDARRLSLGVQLLPGMLGADGPRHYLLIIENNAEIRSGGGVAGAFADIRVDSGRIKLVRQGSSATIGSFDAPVVKTTSEEDALLGPRFALFPQNVTESPDFSRTAVVAREMWRRSTGIKVDGVVSIDPGALSYVLRGLGPVVAPDGTKVTSQNAVSLLLNQVYREIPDPAAQDVFFAGVAKAVFDAIASGSGDSHEVLSGLVRAAEEGRVHVWSAVPQEESLLADTRIAGLVPSTSDGHPEVGVYFDESTASKMDYYLQATASLAQSRCRAGAQQMHLELDLKNTLDVDPSTLPAYVVGQSGKPFPPGTILLTIYVLAPVDGGVQDGVVDGSPGVVNYLTYQGRTVGAQTIPIAPGQSRKVSFKIQGGAGDLLDPRLVMTPTAQSAEALTVQPSQCG